MCRELREIDVPSGPVCTPARSRSTTTATSPGSRSTSRRGSSRPRPTASCGSRSTVRDMMLGGAAGFDERGEHELKGIDGSWKLFAVR